MSCSGARAARLACSWRTTLGAVIWEGNLWFAVRAAQEFCFVDLLDAERFSLVELRPGVGADHQGSRFLGQAVGDVAPGALDQVPRLLPRQRGQGPGNDVGLIGERPGSGRRGGLLERESQVLEPLQQLLVTWLLEESRNGFGDGRTDAPDLSDFCGGGGRECLQGAEMPCQELRSLLADVANAEPEEQSRERLLLGLVDRIHQ